MAFVFTVVYCLLFPKYSGHLTRLELVHRVPFTLRTTSERC